MISTFFPWKESTKLCSAGLTDAYSRGVVLYRSRNMTNFCSDGITAPVGGAVAVAASSRSISSKQVVVTFLPLSSSSKSASVSPRTGFPDLS